MSWLYSNMFIPTLCSVSCEANELLSPCSGGSSSATVCQKLSLFITLLLPAQKEFLPAGSWVGEVVLRLLCSFAWLWKAQQRGVHCSFPFVLCTGLIQCSILLLWQQNRTMQPGDTHLEYCWSLNKQHFLGYGNAETLLCNLGVLAKMSAGAFNVPLWTKKKSSHGA